METSKTLSILMIGENQPSERKRGYEMTKKLRKIFSPRLISLGVTLRADGAIMSFSSSIPASKISWGRIEEISGFSLFLPNNLSRMLILSLFLGAFRFLLDQMPCRKVQSLLRYQDEP